MDKILNRFGIYDLIAVLLTGICILTFSIIILQFVYKIKIDSRSYINETLLFLVISYFLGLIFQEISSFVQKIILGKKDRLLIAALKTSNYSHNLFD